MRSTTVVILLCCISWTIASLQWEGASGVRRGVFRRPFGYPRSYPTRPIHPPRMLTLAEVENVEWSNEALSSEEDDEIIKPAEVIESGEDSDQSMMVVKRDVVTLHNCAPTEFYDQERKECTPCMICAYNMYEAEVCTATRDTQCAECVRPRRMSIDYWATCVEGINGDDIKLAQSVMSWPVFQNFHQDIGSDKRKSIFADVEEHMRRLEFRIHSAIKNSDESTSEWATYTAKLKEMIDDDRMEESGEPEVDDEDDVDDEALLELEEKGYADEVAEKSLDLSILDEQDSEEDSVPRFVKAETKEFRFPYKGIHIRRDPISEEDKTVEMMEEGDTPIIQHGLFEIVKKPINDDDDGETAILQHGHFEARKKPINYDKSSSESGEDMYFDTDDEKKADKLALDVNVWEQLKVYIYMTSVYFAFLVLILVVINFAVCPMFVRHSRFNGAISPMSSEHDLIVEAAYKRLNEKNPDFAAVHV